MDLLILGDLKRKILLQSDMYNSNFIDSDDADSVVASVDGTSAGIITIATNPYFSINNYVMIKDDNGLSARGYIVGISGLGPYTLHIQSSVDSLGTDVDLSAFTVANGSTVYSTSTKELTNMVQDSIKGLYDMLIKNYEDYFTKSVNFTSVANINTYSLRGIAPDFYKFMGVDYTDSGNRIFPLKKMLWREREKYTNYTPGNNQGFNLRYRLMGDNLVFMPLPTTSMLFHFHYIPIVVLPVADSDTFDFINGWDSYVLWDCVVKCLQKEESDVQVAMAERAGAEKRIMEMIQNRDANEADRILNLYDAPYRNRNLTSIAPPDDGEAC